MKTGRRIIVLICSVLLLVFLISCSSLALAEEVPELNWADLAVQRHNIMTAGDGFPTD